MSASRATSTRNPDVQCLGLLPPKNRERHTSFERVLQRSRHVVPVELPGLVDPGRPAESPEKFATTLTSALGD